MDIKTILSMKKGVKGLEIECGTVKRVMDKQAHKGKEYKGKMLPDWYTQSCLVADDSGETWLQLSKGFLTQEAEGKSLNFKELEINEYTNKKGELVKSLICHEIPVGGTQTQTAKPEQPKTPITTGGNTKPRAEREMWESKERRDIRKTLFDTALMSLTRNINPQEELKDAVLIQLVSNIAEAGFNFVYELDKIKDDAGIGTDNLSLKEKGAE